jgi:hypothetical protein
MSFGLTDSGLPDYFAQLAFTYAVTCARCSVFKRARRIMMAR